jgi:hypothetical protein
MKTLHVSIILHLNCGELCNKCCENFQIPMSLVPQFYCVYYICYSIGIYYVGIVVCCGSIKFLGSTFVIPSLLAHIVHGFVGDKSPNSYVVPLGLASCSSGSRHSFLYIIFITSVLDTIFRYAFVYVLSLPLYIFSLTHYLAKTFSRSLTKISYIKFQHISILVATNSSTCCFVHNMV